MKGIFSLYEKAENLGYGVSSYGNNYLYYSRKVDKRQGFMPATTHTDVNKQGKIVPIGYTLD